jgi:hypothetical protein
MKVDLNSENFDLYFYHQLEKMTPAGKEKLPKDVTAILWKKDGRVNKQGFKKFNFMHRLYILWLAGNKQSVTVVLDDVGGFSPEQFCEYKKALNKKDWGVDAASRFTSGDPNFVLGNKELFESFSYLNYLFNSQAYNYLNKLKRPIANRMVEANEKMVDFIRMLRTWEGNKKRWVAEMNISVPEVYILICLYGEGEVAGSTIYKDTFSRAFQSSPHKIKVSFGVLQNKGLIERLGVRKYAKFRITPLGMETLNRILLKYSLN